MVYNYNNDGPGLEVINKCNITDIEDFVNIPGFSQSLSILNVNLWGLHSNFVSLKAFLFQIKRVIKVIVITESHTDDNSTGNL